MSGGKATPAGQLRQADSLAKEFGKATDDTRPGEDGFVSVDLRSLAATYERQRKSGTDRAQYAYARALLKRANFEGHKIPSASSSSGSSSTRKSAASRGSSGGSGSGSGSGG